MVRRIDSTGQKRSLRELLKLEYLTTVYLWSWERFLEQSSGSFTDIGCGEYMILPHPVSLVSIVFDKPSSMYCSTILS